MHGARKAGFDTELNLGVGLSYTVSENERGIQFVEAGLYRDSGSRLAKIAGMGYQYKLGKRWRLGGALLGIQSRTYNGGSPFIALRLIQPVRHVRLLLQRAVSA